MKILQKGKKQKKSNYNKVHNIIIQDDDIIFILNNKKTISYKEIEEILPEPVEYNK